mmetsp:Transcript_20961/g.30470  ORF Transcript_20961/g.30470 Transcript_20961/m.30470 type:complete len:121 (-) Transcript_20961:326-688(-)
MKLAYNTGRRGTVVKEGGLRLPQIMVPKIDKCVGVLFDYKPDFASCNELKFYSSCAAQIPKATIANKPSREATRIWVLDASAFEATTSPAFFANLLFGARHWGHLKLDGSSSKATPSFCP